MTEEQKEKLIAKMLDAPSSLSDKELDSILRDEELRDIYGMSAAISGACVRQPELDMNVEWIRFRRRIHRKPSVIRLVMRVAAVFLGVVLASGIVVRIIDNVFTTDRPSVISMAEPSPISEDTDGQQATGTSVAEDASVVEPEAGRSLPDVHGLHLAKAGISSSSPSVPQSGKEMDVDEYLRIQQARVDNDLALLAAESYMEEYDGLITILEAAGALDPELENVIRNVTME